MKLYPKAKPVKIRMEYRGKEHYSLDTILKEFDFLAICRLIANSQFIKWLEQLNERRLIDSLQPIIVNMKNGVQPQLEHLIMAFYPDFFNGRKKSFKESYIYFNSSSQGQNIAIALLKNEFDKDYKSKEVNEILRGFNEVQLKSQGYVENEILKINYDLAKAGDEKAKKFILNKFKHIRNFDSLEIFFYQRTPKIKDIEDLPLIFSLWKENGLTSICDLYLQNNMEFISSNEMLSEFSPNIKYHQRFKNLNKDEIDQLIEAIFLAKKGKTLSVTPIHYFNRNKNYLNTIDNLRKRIFEFNNNIYFDFYNCSIYKIQDIYEFTIINIGKVYLNDSPLISTKYNSSQYYSKKRKKADYLDAMQTVLDAYLYSEIAFKKIHPDLPYINSK